MESDELAAVCPVTGQPDMYVATIEYWPLPVDAQLDLHGLSGGEARSALGAFLS